MTDPIIPSKDPADDASMGSMLRATFRKMLMSVDGMLPATVVSYNRATNRATVVPSITMLTTAGEPLPRAAMANLPVLALGGGGFTITFPLRAGDTGWIEASDRDVSLWLQAAGAQSTRPNTHRMHSFSDGRFIPDVLGKYTLPGGSDADMVIQSLDGSTYIAIAPDAVRIVASDNVHITAPQTTIEGAVRIVGPTEITGGLVIDGVTFGTHTHGGVEPGGSNTGGPQ